MKVLRLFYFILILLLTAVSIGAADQNDGLVLYLPFEEPSQAGVFFDKSGLDNHAQTSGVIWGTNHGRIGSGIQFINGNNGFLRILKNASLNIGAGDGFTMMTWYN